jgi:phosphatidylglycerophosphate synthase
VEPRWLGKSTTFLQMAVVITSLAFSGQAWTAWVLWAMVAATALSTMDYVWLGARKIGELG